MATRETARLTADVVLLADRDGKQDVLLIRRGKPPFRGLWALPGGAVDRVEPVGVYSEPGRDPRGGYVSFACLARATTAPDATAADDAEAVWWAPVADVLADPTRLAFDHHQILADALSVAETGRTVR